MTPMLLPWVSRETADCNTGGVAPATEAIASTAKIAVNQEATPLGPQRVERCEHREQLRLGTQEHGEMRTVAVLQGR